MNKLICFIVVSMFIALCSCTKDSSSVAYTINTSVSPASAGSSFVNSKKTIALEEGANARLSISTNAGYAFDGWYEGSVKISTDSTMSFRVSADRNLVAKFVVAKTFNVHTFATTGGSAKGSGAYSQNAEVKITASPQSKYTFDGWYELNTKLTADSIYSFVLTSDRSFIAKFVLATVPPTYYKVNTTSSTGGSATGSGSYVADTTVQISASSASGYFFDGWYENNLKVSGDSIYIFKITADRNLQARFTKNPVIVIHYNVSTSAAVGGSVYFGSGSYVADTTVRVSAAAATGYSFDGWYENNLKVSSDSIYSFKITADRNLQAQFTANSYLISTSVNPAAGGSISGGGTYKYNSTVYLSATRNTGYTFDGWYVNGDWVSSSTSYIFTVVGNASVEAKYTKTFAVTLVAEGGGTVSGGGAYTVNNNTYVSASANTGYTFLGWYNGDVLVSTSDYYYITVTKDVTITAKFAVGSNVSNDSIIDWNNFDSSKIILN